MKIFLLILFLMLFAKEAFAYNISEGRVCDPNASDPSTDCVVIDSNGAVRVVVV